MDLLNKDVEKLFFQSNTKDEFEIIIDQKQMNMLRFMKQKKTIIV